MAREKQVVNPTPNFKKAKKVALSGLLFALALILSFLESLLPSVVAALPGVRLGLSNIVVMYALFFLGTRQAYSITLLKSVFVLATRGGVAGILSGTGGFLSLTVIVLLTALFRERISYSALSIGGALSHNIGQFIAISLIYPVLGLWGYLPVLLAAGVGAGIGTSVLLRFALPALKKLDIQ